MNLAAFIRDLTLFLKPSQIIGADQAEMNDYIKDESIEEGWADLIILPENHSQVQRIVKMVNKIAAPWAHLTVRGLGSGLSGAAVPQGGIVLAFDRLNQIKSFNRRNRIIEVMAGCSVDQINDFVAEEGFFFAAAPSSSAISSIGGNIATNAAGPRSFKYGSLRHHIAQVHVIWPDGSEDWVGALPAKSNVGFDLKQLLIGSEGRLGIITEAKLRLLNKPPSTILVLVSCADYNDFPQVFDKIRRRENLSCCELIDEFALNCIRFSLPSNLHRAKCLLLLEFCGAAESLDADLFFLQEELGESYEISIASDTKAQKSIWDLRKSITMELKKISKYKIGEDFSVPVDKVVDLIRCSHELGIKNGLNLAVWGHAGDGNLHVNFLYDAPKELEKIWLVIGSLAEFCVKHGGSLSGEHGLGTLKRSLLPLEKSANQIEFEKKIKNLFDPKAILNRHLN